MLVIAIFLLKNIVKYVSSVLNTMIEERLTQCCVRSRRLFMNQSRLLLNSGNCATHSVSSRSTA